MSYILDALRRADAERDRGNVPSLHTQPAYAAGAAGSPAARSNAGRPWLWGAIGALAVVAAGAVAWTVFGPGARRDAAVGADTSVSRAPEGEGSAAPTAASPAFPPPAVAERGAPGVAPGGRIAGGVDSAYPTTPPAADSPRTAAVRPAPPVVERAPAAARAAARPAPTASAAIPGSPGSPGSPGAPVDPTAVARADTRARTAPPAASAEAVEALADLPPEVRRELPPLAVGGSMYAPTPSARLLIVNGQVLHEGESLAPGLTLRQIRLKSAVFSFRDRRFEIRY